MNKDNFINIALSAGYTVSVLSLIFLGGLFSGVSKIELQPDTQLVVTELYTAEFEGTKLRSIEYLVTPESVKPKFQTNRNWKASPLGIPDDVYRKRSEKQYKYDRGHSLALDLTDGRKEWALVNDLSIIIPQLPELNRGPWKSWEQELEKRAEAGSILFVRVEMGYTEDSDFYFGPVNQKYLIPSVFYCIVRDWNSGIESVQHWEFPNSKEVVGQSVDSFVKYSSLVE